MKLTVHLEGNNSAELASGLRAHLALFENADLKGTDNVDTQPTTKTKKTKAASEETFGEEETIEEETETETTEETPEHTVEEVRAAFASYVKRSVKKGMTQEIARTKAVALLKKTFKVNKIDELEPTQYGEAIELVS